MEISILDMPFLIAEEITEQGVAPVWTSAKLPNTILRLYQVPVVDDSTGEEMYGYTLALEMFGIPAWYCTVILVSEEESRALIPLDVDVVSMFSALEAEMEVPLPTYFAMLRTATAPIVQEMGIDPVLAFVHDLWLHERVELISAAMVKKLAEEKADDPFAKFIEDELEGLDD